MNSLQDAKSLIKEYYTELDAAKTGSSGHVLARYCADEIIWRGYHPFNEINNARDVAEHFWDPLKVSLTSMKRRMDLFFAGQNEIDGFQSTWVASMGHLMGLFDHQWLGIEPTGKIVMLRYGAFHKIENSKIVETAMFIDIPHLMQQAGQNPFHKETGQHLVQPGPALHAGLLFTAQDPRVGEETLAAINYMTNDIKSWSGGREEPLVDELRRSWNEDMIWWGPAGIGATYTIERYAEQHAGPFRDAFGSRKFNGHLCRMAEGMYGGFFGWPNLTLNHKGGFMGMPATNQSGDMRVIDFYRREGDKLSENWVFIDLLHFWKQQGLDVLGRVERIGNRKR